MSDYPIRNSQSEEELFSLPYSVRTSIKRSETAFDEGREDDAFRLLNQAGQELARHSPDLLGLIVGLTLGENSLVLEQSETSIHKVENEKRLLGVRVASESTTTSISRTSRKRISFE